MYRRPRAAYEKRVSAQVVEQVVRPTGLIDPAVEIRPVRAQVDDLLSEIRMRAQANERVLVTTLTKRMAEDLTEYLERARRQGALSACRHRDRRALGNHSRPALGQVRRDRRHQSAARRTGHAGSLVGRHPRCRQGRIPALRGFAHSDHRPGGAQRPRQGDPLRGRAYRIDRASHRRNRPAPLQADRVQHRPRHHPAQHRQSGGRRHGRRARGAGAANATVPAATSP